MDIWNALVLNILTLEKGWPQMKIRYCPACDEEWKQSHRCWNTFVDKRCKPSEIKARAKSGKAPLHDRRTTNELAYLYYPSF